MFQTKVVEKIKAHLCAVCFAKIVSLMG